ncbi:hypothetical protein C9374_013772 [Naegleria lovaniensis]|uniref:Endonuclease/exonuclease/phosphatase domain-containing protein n=1 Tax=Naegleria lovaniensis TaxID=51637 RepID=A0AA88GBL9_NAELO|nr:uncharacterized protein C9374_013772 [Naegleria lovaniensis]KAG2370861.1 hypothetical protein C9374_013772 [Naegleria lovaniensis]
MSQEPIHTDHHEQDSLTCCTFNIHHFCTAKGKSNLNRLLKYLTIKDYDIIGLNEVSTSQFQYFLSELNEKQIQQGKSQYEYFEGNANGYYESNAVLSKFKILEGASEQIADDRCIVGVKIDNVHVPFVFLTHLDHVQEKKRMKQMKRGVKFMEEFMEEHDDEEESNKKPNHQMNKTQHKSHAATHHKNDESVNTKTTANYILMGDFNSMRDDDYTPEFWNKIKNQRIEWGWEPAHTMIAEYLFEGKYCQNDDYDEFYDQDDDDKYKQRNLVSKVDCWKQCHPNDLLDDDRVIGSSRLNTRIDYIICNEELKSSLTECNIDEEGATISDHLPVFAIFEFDRPQMDNE